MIKYENQCVGCPTEMGCIGSACKYMDVPVFYCDECKSDVDKLYEFNGYEYCDCCLAEIAVQDFNDMSNEEKIQCVLGNEVSEVSG